MPEVTQQDWHALRDDIGELKEVIKDVVRALERLARLEERHESTRDGLERAFVDLSKMDLRLVAFEGRLNTLEIEMPAVRRQVTWVDKGIYSLVGLVAMYLLKKAGLV